MDVLIILNIQIKCLMTCNDLHFKYIFLAVHLEISFWPALLLSGSLAAPSNLL